MPLPELPRRALAFRTEHELCAPAARTRSANAPYAVFEREQVVRVLWYNLRAGLRDHVRLVHPGRACGVTS